MSSKVQGHGYHMEKSSSSGYLDLCQAESELDFSYLELCQAASEQDLAQSLRPNTSASPASSLPTIALPPIIQEQNAIDEDNS